MSWKKRYTYIKRGNLKIFTDKTIHSTFDLEIQFSNYFYVLKLGVSVVWGHLLIMRGPQPSIYHAALK